MEKYSGVVYCRGFMFYISYLYLFTNTGVQHDSISDDVRGVLAVTRRVQLLEQERLTLPKHLFILLNY